MSVFEAFLVRISRIRTRKKSEYGVLLDENLCRIEHHIIYTESKLAKNRLSYTRELFKECKVLNVYLVNIWKYLFLCIKLTQILHPQIFSANLKSPLKITQQTSLELIMVYNLSKVITVIDPAETC